LTSEARPGWGDQLAKKDIDFAFMREEAETKAGEFYDKVIAIIGHLPHVETWTHVRDTMFPDDIKKARDYFHDQPRIKALDEWDKKNGTHEFIFMDVEEFNSSREEYVKNAGDSSFVPFAVIKDKQWYGRGEMGWWGSVSDEEDKSNWNSKVAKFIEELDGEMILSVYDCHI
jgi:hypothetical protein